MSGLKQKTPDHHVTPASRPFSAPAGTRDPFNTSRYWQTGPVKSRSARAPTELEDARAVPPGAPVQAAEQALTRAGGLHARRGGQQQEKAEDQPRVAKCC
ncbi:hypothetical protein ACOMHN_003906 [Nucella lapillus]